jgi:hypothetical protein
MEERRKRGRELQQIRVIGERRKRGKKYCRKERYSRKGK